MANLNYYLKGALSENKIEDLKQNDKAKLNEKLIHPLQIILKVSLPGERLQIYTTKRIPQIMWNKEKQEANCRKYKTACSDFNEWLIDFKAKVGERYNELEKSGTRITKNDLDEILKSKILPRIKITNIEEQFNFFISEYKPTSGKALKPNTIKKYTGLQNHIERFCKDKNIKFGLQSITKTFMEKFKDYLVYEEGLSDNTISKYIKALKTFSNFYMDKGKIKPFDLRKIKWQETEGEIYVLSIKQVLYLQNKEIKNPSYKKVRDIFCFMCWTGQRFNDTMELKRQDIHINENGDKEWNLITGKTNDKISVPIIPQAEKILAKYKKHITPLPIISNQKMNEYLKKLGEKVDFNKPTKVVRYYNGQKSEATVPFYEVLTTHVARKSYITNSLTLGIPERIVRNVSGHKDEKSFRRYVNLAKSFKNQVVQDAYSEENLSKFIKERE